MFASNGRRQQPPQASEEAVMDPREIDKVLSEIAGMLGRWNMFKRFLLDSSSVTMRCLSLTVRNIDRYQRNLPPKMKIWKMPYLNFQQMGHLCLH